MFSSFFSRWPLYQPKWIPNSFLGLSTCTILPRAFPSLGTGGAMSENPLDPGQTGTVGFSVTPSSQHLNTWIITPGFISKQGYWYVSGLVQLSMNVTRYFYCSHSSCIMAHCGLCVLDLFTCVCVLVRNRAYTLQCACTIVCVCVWAAVVALWKHIIEYVSRVPHGNGTVYICRSHS